MSLGIDSAARFWFYWGELAGGYVLVDSHRALNRVVGFVPTIEEALDWLHGLQR